MKPNMGSPDRLVRGLVVAPLALIVAFVLGIGSVAGVILVAVAVIMAVTAVVGFCPLYRVLGFSSERHTPAPR
jgi:hypothetical protein